MINFTGLPCKGKCEAEIQSDGGISKTKEGASCIQGDDI